MHTYKFSKKKHKQNKYLKEQYIGYVLKINLLFVIASSLLFLGYVPQPKNRTETQQSSHTKVIVYVLDLLTKQPISGANVTVSGIERLGIADHNGRIVMSIPSKHLDLAISAIKDGYLKTTETMIDPHKRKIVILELPPLGKLKEADAFVRDPRTLDPHRQQTWLGRPLEPPTQKAVNIKIPIGILTHPLAKKIKVILGKDANGNLITRTLGLEEYLKGVLPREIGISYPMESIKAQAVAARTFTLKQTNYGKEPICITTTCQVWGTKQYARTNAAVMATAGQVAIYTGSDTRYKGKLAGGNFAASCGGSTIDSSKKWSYRPFLKARPCIENKKNYCKVVCSGRTKNSTCWGVFGHRIGLCQRGAQSMGKCGKKYDEIVRHYYTDTEIANRNTPATPTNNAKLVRETLPSGSTLIPNQAFSKEWVMENTGDTTWTSAAKYHLARLDGTSFGGTNTIGLANGVSVKKGQTHSFVIQLRTPSAEGVYKARWQMQKDGIGFGSIVTLELIVKKPKVNCVDNDNDGFPAPKDGCPKPYDCDDNNKNINPNAKEICGNNIDENCQGGDLKCPVKCQDADKDGFFAAKDGCPKPYDCDDNNKNINPNAKEVCGNNIDENCQGGDLPCPKNCVDADKDGYGVGSDCPQPVDCNDNDKTVYPGAPEICGNGKDEDCREGDAICGKKPNPATPKNKKKMGTVGCVKHSECETNACVELDGKRICTARCSATSQQCPFGFTCVQNTACWPKKEVPTNSVECRETTDCKSGLICLSGKCTARTKRGCGCSSTPETPSHPFMWFLTLGLLGWLLKRNPLTQT